MGHNVCTYNAQYYICNTSPVIAGTLKQCLSLGGMRSLASPEITFSFIYVYIYIYIPVGTKPKDVDVHSMKSKGKVEVKLHSFLISEVVDDV